MIYILFFTITLLILLLVLYQLQYFMVFTPLYHRKEILDDSYEYLSITTDDGIELEGIVYNHPEPRTTILFFGGRSHDSVGLIRRLKECYTDARIITFNYRSYGRSKGVVNEKNILADGLKIAQIVHKNYGDFYLLGFSLGSYVSAFIASHMNVLGVFMVGSFDSVSRVIKTRYGVNLSWFLRYKLDVTKYISKVDAPTYLFVSKDDETIPLKNGRNLKIFVKNLEFYKEYDGLSHKELLWDKETISQINRKRND
ncbi:MAG: alpha/beta hydrolase [Sulfurimonadaceae bacterium]|jgi:pimeloyl-ACP methyl ester carboxylesterase|nr:alpha/beta hydrolase [Sulfurimonadaceae bacterium]